MGSVHCAHHTKHMHWEPFIVILVLGWGIMHSAHTDLSAHINIEFFWLWSQRQYHVTIAMHAAAMGFPFSSNFSTRQSHTLRIDAFFWTTSNRVWRAGNYNGFCFWMLNMKNTKLEPVLQMNKIQARMEKKRTTTTAISHESRQNVATTSPERLDDIVFYYVCVPPMWFSVAFFLRRNWKPRIFSSSALAILCM